jgi:GTPase-associated protein 1, N-terminal domain type 2
MTTATAEPRSLSHARAAGIEQIYITHCLHGQGKFPQSGFNVRAASTDDPLLLRFALEYPHYELPFVNSGQEIASQAAPRRLALVRIPGGKNALIHSVYLPGASGGRSNNFFTQMLVFPALTARQALPTWASPDWVIECERVASTTLPLLAELPAAGSIDDEAVTGFLKGQLSTEDQDLATSIFPARLANAPERCRELVKRVICGCQRALTAGPADPRRRFFLLAEPGLTALLLYAASRFLPAAVAARLTFSTFEPARGGQLRHFELAHVIGSYGDDPTWQHQDLLAGRGYSFDTFKLESSPELADGKGTDLDEWIDLAGRGDWQTIDKAHGVLGEKNTVILSFQEAVEAATLSAHLDSGEVAAEELVALKRKPWGQALLNRHRATVWPLVREASLTDPALRDQFADVLREHLPELQRRTADALRNGVQSEWRLRWRQVRFLLKDDARRLWETFERILPEQPYPPKLRVSLLQEIHELGMVRVNRRLRFHALIRNCTVEELDELVGSNLPREWVIWALCYGLLHGLTKPHALRCLHEADPALLRTFWREFQLLKNEEQRRGLLEPLFPASVEGIRFFGRLLESRCRVRPPTLQWLMDSLGVWKKEWHSFWLEKNRLSCLIELVRRSGAEAQPIWDLITGQVDADLLIPGESYQRTLLSELAAARDRPGPALPAGTAQAIGDWVLLQKHFQNACGIADADRQAIIDACNRRGLDPIDLLAGYFKQFVLPQGFNRVVLDDFAAFFHSFSLERDEYQKYSSRLLWWLNIVEACPLESARAAYQQYYFDQFIPFDFRWRLADESYRGGKLLPVVFEGMPRPTEATGEQGQVHFEVVISDLFRLTGVRPEALETADALRPQELGWLRFSWLIPSVAGGILAALVCAAFRSQLQKTPLVAIFIPVVYALAESLALQSVGVGFRSLGQRKRVSGLEIRRDLRRESVIGLCLGVLCAAIFGGLAIACRGSARLIFALVGGLAASMAGAAALGTILPILLRSRGWESRLSAGDIVRPAAGVLAIFLYLSLAAWLLR